MVAERNYSFDLGTISSGQVAIISIKVKRI